MRSVANASEKEKTMRFSWTTLVLFLLMLACVAVSQIPRPPVQAQRGDVATGVVESEREGYLYLNTTPCIDRERAQIIVFHQPYKKMKIPQEPISCYGHQYDRFRVEQQ